MKNRKTIFLSYRRDDNPGYVRQLQEDLQRHFGENSVFRDVEDIVGGAPWKQVLENSLTDSAALIVIIGSRWEQIWNERSDKSSDYIVYELNYANDRGIPIIPVTVDGARLSGGIELGPLSWLMEKQFYDISDRQRRWSTDVAGLAKLLEDLPGLTGTTPQKATNSGSKIKWLLAPLAVALLLIVASVFYKPAGKPEPDLDGKPEPVVGGKSEPVVGGKSEPVVGGKSEPVVGGKSEPVAGSKSEPVVEESYPDISGVWVADDGTTYKFGPVSNGRFIVDYLGTEGAGEYIPRMPRKFSIQVDGIGKGEYSYSNDNKKIVGWFVQSGKNQQNYNTLYRQE